MLRSFRSQSPYLRALRPFSHHTTTISASKQNLSITACKHKGCGVLSKMAEDGQNPHGHQLRIQPKLGDKPQPGHNKELQRLDDWWLKYSQEQEQEIQNLTAALMRERAEKVRVKEYVKIYRAIEYILVLSGEEGVIPKLVDVESEIYVLTKIPEFTEILHKEAQARGLVFEDVLECARSLYVKLLPPACDRDDTVVIRDVDFTEKERAALVTFMKVQSEWDNAVSWREDVSAKADKGNVQGC